MKKCPNCQATFDDNMRFCQTDGTPLVDDTPPVDNTPPAEPLEAEPAFDPYATIVGTVAPPSVVEEPVFEAAPEPEPAVEEAAAEEPTIHQTIGSVPIAPPEDVLDLPSNDPLKTMYVSETEMQAALGTTEPDIVEIPPIEETPAPEPPSFLTPEPPPTPFDAPPPSPFAAPEEPVSSSSYEEPAYDEAATMIQPSFEPPPFEPSSPAFGAVPSAFETPTAAPVAEWTPPPAPDAGWANQEIGSNTPFQPPPAGAAAGDNKTLPIVSLVLGIVSLCCYISPLTGLGALITGYLGMKNANNDPNTYGGKGLAIAGMITGGIFFLIGVAYYVIVILMYAGVIAGSMLQGY